MYDFRCKESNAYATKLPVSKAGQRVVHPTVSVSHCHWPNPVICLCPLYDPCQCVLKCEKRDCTKAVALCKRLPQCKYVIEKKKGAVAILKRGASEQELTR